MSKNEITFMIIDDPLAEPTEEDKKKLLAWWEKTKGILLEDLEDDQQHD
jgi:hypothetical protein